MPSAHPESKFPALPLSESLALSEMCVILRGRVVFLSKAPGSLRLDPSSRAPGGEVCDERGRTHTAAQAGISGTRGAPGARQAAAGHTVI